jgi:hypothetical protein
LTNQSLDSEPITSGLPVSGSRQEFGLHKPSWTLRSVPALSSCHSASAHVPISHHATRSNPLPVGMGPINSVLVQNMRNISVIIAILCICGCAGRATSNLHDSVDPNKMYAVSKSEFEKNRAKFTKNDYVQLGNGNYLVHKSDLEKIGDYSIIVVSAPITISLDAIMYVVEGVGTVVVGALPRGSTATQGSIDGAQLLGVLLTGIRCH